MNNKKIIYCILACFLGPALGGYFVGRGIEHFKLNDRTVVVKGLSERDVKSDLAVWTLTYKNSGEDLTLLEKRMADHKSAIEEFFIEAGFSKDEISNPSFEIIDKNSREYGYDGEKSPRYILSAKMQVRTTKVDLVVKTQEQVTKLIRQGVVVSGSPSFYYTKLLEIKPSMIAEATQNARLAAKQFADDSGCGVGSIRSANQGVFSILPQDMGANEYGSELASVNKKVRVLSSFTFSLDK